MSKDTGENIMGESDRDQLVFAAHSPSMMCVQTMWSMQWGKEGAVKKKARATENMGEGEGKVPLTC